MGFFKFIGIQMVQGRIMNYKWNIFTKIFVFVLMFGGQVYYNTYEFVKTRPLTLYDHFKVHRMADF